MTLNEKYELRNKLRRIDESKRLLEAFDKKTMNAALEIIKKLKTAEFDIEILDQARLKAIEDVTESLRGDKSSNILQKLANLFVKKKPQVNPINKTLTFINSIINFFDLFMPYLDELTTLRLKIDGNNTIVTDDKTTLIEMITGIRGATIETLKKSDKNAKKRFNDFTRLIKNGLKPDPQYGESNAWYQEYIGGEAGANKIAQQLLSKNVEQIRKIHQILSDDFDNLDTVNQEIQQPPTGKEEPIQTTDTTTKTDINTMKNIAANISKVTGVETNTTLKVINALNSAGKLK